MFSEKFTSVLLKIFQGNICFPWKKKGVGKLKNQNIPRQKKVLSSEKLWEMHSRAYVLLLSKGDRGPPSSPSASYSNLSHQKATRGYTWGRKHWPRPTGLCGPRAGMVHPTQRAPAVARTGMTLLFWYTFLSYINQTRELQLNKPFNCILRTNFGI